MAVTLIGLRSARKTTGTSPAGIREYYLKSDTQITTDIDQILDSTDIPAYDESWDASTNVNLVVRTKQAQTLDDLDGYYWNVRIQYETPTGDSDQDALDPRDRPWDWSKTTDKYEQVIPNSLYNTSGYVYPNTDASNMINLNDNQALTNSVGQPVEGGVSQMIARNVFNMTKYVDRADGYTDIVTGATSWADLDAFIDTVNGDSSYALLDTTYSEYQLRCDDINYRPYSENGYDVMEVTVTVVADTYRKHIFTYANAGYKELKDGFLVPVGGEGGAPLEPALLTKDGSAIPDPALPPYVKTPILISAGVNEKKTWNGWLLPSTIP